MNKRVLISGGEVHGITDQGVREQTRTSDVGGYHLPGVNANPAQWRSGVMGAAGERTSHFLQEGRFGSVKIAPCHCRPLSCPDSPYSSGS